MKYQHREDNTVKIDMSVKVEEGRTYRLMYDLIPVNNSSLDIPLPNIECDIWNIVLKEVKE